MVWFGQSLRLHLVGWNGMRMRIEWNEKKVINDNNTLIINDSKILSKNNFKKVQLQHINKIKNIYIFM